MWNAGCQEATGDVEFLVQRAVYVVGPVKFRGPCKARSIFFNMQVSNWHSYLAIRLYVHACMQAFIRSFVANRGT